MLTITTVPAQPGWYIAEFSPSGKSGSDSWGDHLRLDPIIAWRIDGGGRAVPITINGIRDPSELSDLLNQPWVIKRPDGMFDVNGCAWKAEADVIEELRKRYDAETDINEQLHKFYDAQTKRVTRVSHDDPQRSALGVKHNGGSER